MISDFPDYMGDLRYIVAFDRFSINFFQGAGYILVESMEIVLVEKVFIDDGKFEGSTVTQGLGTYNCLLV